MDSRGEQGASKQDLKPLPFFGTMTKRQGLADETKGGARTKLAANTGFPD
jgi:hypothetical protein